MLSRTVAVGAVAGVLVLSGLGAAPALAEPAGGGSGLRVEVSLPAVGAEAPLDGRVYFLVAAKGEKPLDGIGADGSTMVFGQNVQDLEPGSRVVLTGGGAEVSDSGVYGFPHATLEALPAGDYTVQPFFNLYETVTRSDGSTVQVHFPCGDGGWFWGTPGNLLGAPTDVSVTGGDQTISLTLDSTVPEPSAGPEIGGCQQGNYADTDSVKHVKIRSQALSDFWGRDMYVGANVSLPRGYDPADGSTRYPVIYSQGHWPGDGTAFWGTQTDEFITVTIRQESPYYDDAYAVNSANVGPWGDAINDELIPVIDSTFNTIAAAYARVQEGGSTGGWVSLASTMFRPDLFGSAWSYYPDSLDFHQHQQVDLYEGANAYFRSDGSPIGSWRSFESGSEEVTVTMPDENHYELALGTNSRSFDQWDIWNAVYGPQGSNGYPLDPWDKESGVIDHDTAQLWKPMDLTDYLRSNWSSEKNLGGVLEDRLHVSVGTHDNYYLDGGVALFKNAVEELGGDDWADVTLIDGAIHGGYYDNLDLDDYLARISAWVSAHAPDGATPLTAEDTATSARGNEFAEVNATGGHAAALARQSVPSLDATAPVRAGDTVVASFGTWDPGVRVTGQWFLGDRPVSEVIDPAAPGQTLDRAGTAAARSAYAIPAGAPPGLLRFDVTGSKRGYVTETRPSAAVAVVALPGTVPSGTPGTQPALAATGSPTGADTALVGVAVLMAGALIVAVRRRPSRPTRK